MADIFQLIYLSRAAESLCYSDLHALLEHSIRSNQKNNITGLLLFRDHHFIQILEGEKDKVLETVSRIIRDPRSSHLHILSESEGEERIFTRWPMAFHDGDIDPAASPLVENLFRSALRRRQAEKDRLLQMLQSFRQSCPRFQEA